MTEKGTPFGRFASQARESGAGIEIDYATLAFWEVSAILSLRVGSRERREALSDLLVLLTPYLDNGTLLRLNAMFRNYDKAQRNQRGQNESEREWEERRDKDIPEMDDEKRARLLDKEWFSILLQAMKMNDLLPHGTLRDLQGPHP